MSRKGARVLFRGRVQGVWFRANIRKKALAAGLGGWVRNLEDGSVEALFEGHEESIQRVLDEVGRGEGMGAAVVEQSVVSWVEPGGFAGFDIIRED